MSNEKFTGVESKLVTGFLRGYRQWRAGDLGTRKVICSLNDSTEWHDGKLEAHCNVDCHQTYHYREFHTENEEHGPVPRKNGSCGIYALLPPTEWGQAASWQLWGSVKLTGRIQVGTIGVRAQKAEIEAIVPCAGSTFQSLEQIIDTLLELLPSVPIYTHPGALIADFPPEDFSSLVDAGTHAKMQEQQAKYIEKMEFQRAQRRRFI